MAKVNVVLFYLCIIFIINNSNSSNVKNIDTYNTYDVISNLQRIDITEDSIKLRSKREDSSGSSNIENDYNKNHIELFLRKKRQVLTTSQPSSSIINDNKAQLTLSPTTSISLLSSSSSSLALPSLSPVPLQSQSSAENSSQQEQQQPFQQHPQNENRINSKQTKMRADDDINNKNNNNNNNSGGGGTSGDDGSATPTTVPATGSGETPKPPIVSEPINSSENNTLQLVVPSNTNAKAIMIGGKGVDEGVVFAAEVEKNETQIHEDVGKNVHQFKEDYHLYYNSVQVQNATLVQEFWKNISNQNLTPHRLLSKSHRRAITVQLTFDFPFYGHNIRNVTVATGGFIYTGDYVHSWLAATQYIAPLMANFDTSVSNDSFVKYYDNGTSFTVLWENVSLQEKTAPNRGPFTFSLTLHDTGDIVFVYYNVPATIDEIDDDTHPVKIGLSDAYIIDKVIFFARRKTIYEYHRVNFANYHLDNSSIIYLFAQTTCIQIKECGDCINNSTEAFQCAWCPTLNRCSTGTDRKRQEWLQQSCITNAIVNESKCPVIGEQGNNYAFQQSVEVHDSTTSKIPNDDNNMNNNNNNDNNNDSKNVSTNTSNNNNLNKNTANNNNNNNNNMNNEATESSSYIHKQSIIITEKTDSSSVGLVLGLFLPMTIVFSLFLWIFYAYRNPHTKSGQLLIQYRPSQWTWRRGEARYTAATIHM